MQANFPDDTVQPVEAVADVLELAPVLEELLGFGDVVRPKKERGMLKS